MNSKKEKGNPHSFFVLVTAMVAALLATSVLAAVVIYILSEVL